MWSPGNIWQSVAIPTDPPARCKIDHRQVVRSKRRNYFIGAGESDRCPRQIRRSRPGFGKRVMNQRCARVPLLEAGRHAKPKQPCFKLNR
jgi:hypothetical protein